MAATHNLVNGGHGASIDENATNSDILIVNNSGIDIRGPIHEAVIAAARTGETPEEVADLFEIRHLAPRDGYAIVVTVDFL